MEDLPADTPRFASSLGIGPDWSQAAKACLDGLTLVPGANLGIVYVTDALADQFSSIVTLLRGVTGVRDWVGTVGLGVCAGSVELFDQPAVSVLLGRFEEGSFAALPPLTDATAPLSSLEPWLRDHAPLLGLVHGDPRHARLPDLLTDLAGRTGCFLVGGLTASRGEQALAAGPLVSGEGVGGVLFDADVPVVTGLTQGSTVLGGIHTITRAEKHVVMEIDGKPALEVFKQDIGPELAGDLRRVGGLVFAGLPIQGFDRGDYLMRNLTAIDLERGWIAIGENLNTGQSILFCRRDREAALADLERMLEQVKRRLSGPVQAGIYISCVARGRNLFGTDGVELGLIRQHLGDFPLTGYFAGGEISNAQLYGYTGVLTLFL
ncbi:MULTISPECIES: FIST C-terminal domain-containing protein [unclassified Azospirillum]|uniref:FIST signal transduction protein n=1 Tax=unclassified Azospirillum TaxID=2630922 RepID=UPI000B6590EA|nr:MULTISPECIES: FIST C-terminal domain-containing protein [unclassified Azospirillum]SNT15110.1 Small ligand-binding sensory domain FIST [Azospirillum sp. RU38E]SNT28161.1 Small ligand-binding sensory domain FIST [Azospirillum sp. RU37A]